MKLGLIADVHESVDFLRAALDRFWMEVVDQIVLLGDVFEMGERIEETCTLLSAAGVIGVWGNHDFGLCIDVDDATRIKYPTGVLTYFQTLRPNLTISDCQFAHVEPWLNPHDIADLWYFDGPPDTLAKCERIFRAMTHRVAFAGHFHKWMLVTPTGISDWHGTSPIDLSIHDRAFVVIGALCLGQFAVLDTEPLILTPHSLV